MLKTYLERTFEQHAFETNNSSRSDDFPALAG